jgi:hypothetical protein
MLVGVLRNEGGFLASASGVSRLSLGTRVVNRGERKGEVEPCRKRVGGDLRKAEEFVTLDRARVILQ